MTSTHDIPGRRIVDHPILGHAPQRRQVRIRVDGSEIIALEGDTIAAALLAAYAIWARHAATPSSPARSQ